MTRTRCPFTECRCNNTLCANAREADERRVYAQRRAGLARERENLLTAAQESGRLMDRERGLMTLTPAQRDAMTAGEWFRSRYAQRRLVASGGSGRYSSINLRTARKLAEAGLIELREGYSRQDGGNVWTATMTDRGEQVRQELMA